MLDNIGGSSLPVDITDPKFGRTDPKSKNVGPGEGQGETVT